MQSQSGGLNLLFMQYLGCSVSDINLSFCPQQALYDSCAALLVTVCMQNFSLHDAPTLLQLLSAIPIELNVDADEGKNAEEWLIDIRAKHAAASQC